MSAWTSPCVSLDQAHHVALHATHGFSGLQSLISFLPGQAKLQPLPKDMGSAQIFAELINETMDK